jgi:hypothetical protein
MKDLIPILILLGIACALAVAYGINRSEEGFEGQIGDRCGVDMPTCKHGTKCINGYCLPTNAPVLPLYSDLKVEPSDPNNLGGFLHTE